VLVALQQTIGSKPWLLSTFARASASYTAANHALVLEWAMTRHRAIIRSSACCLLATVIVYQNCCRESKLFSCIKPVIV
jgi:hypothetical protein